jgi:hypothetical protein
LFPWANKDVFFIPVIQKPQRSQCHQHRLNSAGALVRQALRIYGDSQPFIHDYALTFRLFLPKLFDSGTFPPQWD